MLECAWGTHRNGRVLYVEQKDQHPALPTPTSTTSTGHHVQGFILDLRNNPGGLVKSGMEVARLWMDGEAPVFNLTSRKAAPTGEEIFTEQVVLDAGAAATSLPLTVLINENSASASEILAGALHDNARAELIGRTSFGKGRMQSVYELDDGSALFVTVAKYQTPSMNVRTMGC